MNVDSPLWSAQLAHPAALAPILCGDVLLLPTQPRDLTVPHCSVQAIHWQTGALAWQRELDDSLISGVQPYPAPHGLLALVATQSSDMLEGRGQLIALNQAGEQRWALQSEFKSYGALAKFKQQFVIVAGSSTLQLISPLKRDAPVSISLPHTSSLAAPLLHDFTAFIPCQSPNLLAVDLVGQAVRWQFVAPNAARAWLDKTPVFHQNMLFTVSSQGVVYALDSQSGQLVWEEQVGGGKQLAPPIIVNNLLLVGTRRGLKALDPVDGKLIWHFRTERSVSAAPCVYGKTAYIGCEDHNVYALDLATGEEKWRYEMERRITISPVAVQDRLIVTDRGGLLVALPIAEETQVEAAKAFVVAGEWEKAAALWDRLDELDRRAEALEQQAMQLDKHPVGADRKAKAWETAARAYAEIGRQLARQQCEREVARHRNLPLLVFSVQAKPLQLNAWSTLRYTIQNKGFSSARQIQIAVTGKKIIGHGKETKIMYSVLKGKSHEHWLEILPQAFGSDVPIRLFVTYSDRVGKTRELTYTAYLFVSQDQLSESQAFAMLSAPDGKDLAELRQKIMDYFGKEAMRNLMFELNLRSDNFSDRLNVMAQELIVYALQNGRYAELLALLKQKRPHVAW